MRAANVFTVDLEDWYQGLEIDMSDWTRFAPRIERGLSVLLGLLGEASVKATFFVLGYQAERTPALIREIAAAGHEIASHGFSHRFVYQQTRDEFRADIRRAKQVLEDTTGAPVYGYRAPFFSITAHSQWALDVLVEEGFRYDSSVFPVFNYRYGLPAAARAPHWITTPSGGRLFEIPLSTVRVPSESLPVGVNLPMSGGGYFRLYPYLITRSLARLLARRGAGLVFYVHPWEYDPEHPAIRLPRWLPQLSHYHNLRSMTERTRRLLAEFPFTTIEQAYAATWRAL